MEVIADKLNRRHLGVADLDVFLVDSRIDGAVDFQSGFCRCCADQLDHSKPICQRPSAPVLLDVAKHPVFDLVPLRCARRIMMDMEREPALLGEFLQFHFPKPHTCATRATAITGDG
jgi:hypothetical protein